MTADRSVPRTSLGALALIVLMALGGPLAACSSQSGSNQAPTTSPTSAQGDFNGRSWMSDSTSTIGDIPLSKLVVPGTHDAATGEFTDKNLVVSPSQQDMDVKLLAGVPKDRIFGYIKTQDRTFTQQLDDGIRYLDYRVACDPDGVYTVHILQGPSVESTLTEIGTWVRNHPKEVVFLDVQKAYGCATQTYRSGGGRVTGNDMFVSLVHKAFGSAVAPRPAGANVLTTLNSLASAGTNVVIFYTDKTFAPTQPDLWLRSSTQLPPGPGLANEWFPYATMSEMLTYMLSATKGIQKAQSQALLAAATTTPIVTCQSLAGKCPATLKDFVLQTVTPAVPAMVPELVAEKYDFISTDFYNHVSSNGQGFAQIVVATN